MARSGIKICDILITDNTTISTDGVEETKEKRVTAAFNFLNKTAYCSLILTQKEMVVFKKFKNQIRNPISMGI